MSDERNFGESDWNGNLRAWKARRRKSCGLELGSGEKGGESGSTAGGVYEADYGGPTIGGNSGSNNYQGQTVGGGGHGVDSDGLGSPSGFRRQMVQPKTPEKTIGRVLTWVYV